MFLADACAIFFCKLLNSSTVGLLLNFFKSVNSADLVLLLTVLRFSD